MLVLVLVALLQVVSLKMTVKEVFATNCSYPCWSVPPEQTVRGLAVGQERLP